MLGNRLGHYLEFCARWQIDNVQCFGLSKQMRAHAWKDGEMEMADDEDDNNNSMSEIQ